MRTLLLVCLAVPSFARPIQSLSPPRNRAKQEQTSKKETQGSDPSPERPPSPGTAITSGGDQPAAGNKNSDAKQETNQIWKEALAPKTWSSWALFGAACIAAYIALKTLRAIGNQAEIARLGVEATRVTAEATTVSANATKEAADAAVSANKLANESLALAEAQLRLLEQSNGLTRESNANTEKATELTRQAFILTHRPKLKIRNVEIDGIDSLLRVEGPAESAGTLQVYNSGESAARILGITCKLFAFKALPMRVPFESPTESLDINIPPGVYEARSFAFDAVDFPKFAGLMNKTMGLYILGELVYKDELGVRRTARFCSLFDQAEERSSRLTTWTTRAPTSAKNGINALLARHRWLPRASFSRILKPMEVHFTPEQEAQLAQMATKAGTKPERLVKDVLVRYLDDEARFVAAVERGVAAAERGEFIEEEEMDARIERMLKP